MASSSESHQTRDGSISSSPVGQDGHAPCLSSSAGSTPEPRASELHAPLSVDACVGTSIMGGRNIGTAIGSGGTADPSMNAHLTSTAMQVFVPFILAGIGSTMAGILLDVVKEWPVYVTVHQIFVLIPPLLGLNGNLEQTLVARLSTQANLGNLNRVHEQLPMIFANIALLQCQSTVATVVACTLAIIKGLGIDGKWDTSHMAVLFAGALAAVNTSSLLLNLAPLVIVVCVVLLPVWIVLARRNSVSREVLRVGWLPIITALTISSFGGYILDYAVIEFPPIALHLSSVNALGGNLAAVFSCSLSSYLNRVTAFGQVPHGEALLVGPLQMYYQGGEMANVAYVLVGVVVPGQTLFAVLSRILRFGKISMTITFFAAYIGASLAQVLVLLYLARLIVYRLWCWSIDPDNAAIPCLTGCGDFLGTGFLTLAYALLYELGDKSAIHEEELRSFHHPTTLLTSQPSHSTLDYVNATLS